MKIEAMPYDARAKGVIVVMYTKTAVSIFVGMKYRENKWIVFLSIGRRKFPFASDKITKSSV